MDPYEEIKTITDVKAQAGDIRLLCRRFLLINFLILSNVVESDIGPLRCYKVISIRPKPLS